MSTITRRAVLGAAAAAAIGRQAAAETWPDKPVRLLVPYPVGGIVDIVARAVAEPMQAELGQPIVVDPRPGANSTLATAMIPQAPADGYTWVLATISHVVAPRLQPVSYDPLKDFQAAALVAVATSIATVNANVPVKNLKELVDYARANPGKLNYLNPGNGSSIHLSVELLKSYAKIDMVGVPYRGIPPGMTDLIEGRLQVGFLPGPLALQHIQTGKLRAIGFIGEQRSKYLPDVPTFAEQGFGEAQVMSWYTIALKAGTPPDIVQHIHDVAMKAIAEPQTRERFDKASCEVPAPRSPAAVQALYEADFKRYGKLVKDAGITGG
ncbi:MAG: tripartite tricarboxylate transporter substrate binding protein [Proteobacteria bacterium]|nr:tripartite tricarboxylate transporter substrate binding protein [Pseudomonadota bacterium]